MKLFIGGFIAGVITGASVHSQMFGCSHTPDEWWAMEDAKNKAYTSKRLIEESKSEEKNTE